MRSQEQAFRVYYASMSDSELLRIADHRTSYVPVAQRILVDEMEKRRLTPVEPPAVPKRRSVLRDWRSHLFRFARRLHHHPASP
jgi:hypothetical protein